MLRINRDAAKQAQEALRGINAGTIRAASAALQGVDRKALMQAQLPVIDPKALQAARATQVAVDPGVIRAAREATQLLDRDLLKQARDAMRAHQDVMREALMLPLAEARAAAKIALSELPDLPDDAIKDFEAALDEGDDEQDVSEGARRLAPLARPAVVAAIGTVLVAVIEYVKVQATGEELSPSTVYLAAILIAIAHLVATLNNS